MDSMLVDALRSLLLLAAVEVEPLDEFGQKFGVVGVTDFSLVVNQDETLEQVDMGFGEFDFVGFA